MAAASKSDSLTRKLNHIPTDMIKLRTEKVAAVCHNLPYSSHSGGSYFILCQLRFILCLWSFYFILVSLRYLRNDGKLNALIFSNVLLADGKRHAVLLRLSGLRHGFSKAELYVDCTLMDSIQHLPKVFSGLSQASESMELRTLQKKAQVSSCGRATDLYTQIDWLAARHVWDT